MTDKHVTFVHFTDLHIGDQATDSHLYSDTAANLTRFKEVLATIDPRPSFLLATGDLSNRGDLPSYHKLRALMADVGMPVLYALGNHDVGSGRGPFYEGILDRTEDTTAPYDHDQVIDGVHIIMLDTSEPGRVGGSLTDAQFDWLAAALQRHPEAPKLIGLHHAPAAIEDPDMEWETLRWRDSVRLAGLIKGRPVVGIMCGHLHSDRVTNWHGVPVVMSVGPHMALDPAYARGGIRMVRASGFALCQILPAGLMVNFVTMPADRTEIAVHTPEKVRERMARYQSQAAE